MAAILGVGVVRLLRGIVLIVSSSIKPIFSPNSHVNSTASLVVSAFQNSSSVSTESTGSPSSHFLRIVVADADSLQERRLQSRASSLRSVTKYLRTSDQEGCGNCRSCGSRTIHNHLENPAGLRTVPTASTTNQLKKSREMRRWGHIGYAHTNTKDTKCHTLHIR